MLQVQNFWKILERQGFSEFANSAIVAIQALQAPAYQSDLHKKAIPKDSPVPSALPRCSPRSEVTQRLPSWPTELQRHRRTTQDYTEHRGPHGTHRNARDTQNHAGAGRSTRNTASGRWLLPSQGRTHHTDSRGSAGHSPQSGDSSPLLTTVGHTSLPGDSPSLTMVLLTSSLAHSP